MNFSVTDHLDSSKQKNVAFFAAKSKDLPPVEPKDLIVIVGASVSEKKPSGLYASFIFAEGKSSLFKLFLVYQHQVWLADPDLSLYERTMASDQDAAAQGTTEKGISRGVSRAESEGGGGGVSGAETKGSGGGGFKGQSKGAVCSPRRPYCSEFISLVLDPMIRITKPINQYLYANIANISTTRTKELRKGNTRYDLSHVVISRCLSAASLFCECLFVCLFVCRIALSSLSLFCIPHAHPTTLTARDMAASLPHAIPLGLQETEAKGRPDSIAPLMDQSKVRKEGRLIESTVEPSFRSFTFQLPCLISQQS